MNLFTVKDISCGYGQREVLKGVSFDIEQGQIVGIIGPNGSGKTTLLRALTKALKISSGEIFYKEKPLHNFRLAEFARQVAVIPQRIELPFNTTVEEFITLGCFAHLGRFDFLSQRQRKIIEHVLAMTDLAHLKNQDIREISGGELQRVVLAQGFAQSPQTLILDEPTTHLDITHQIKILNLIKDLNEYSAVNIVLSIHDLNLAAEYCDYLLLLDKAGIFKQGTPGEVLTYENIEKVYKTVVVVKENPISKKPYIVLVSRQ